MATTKQKQLKITLRRARPAHVRFALHPVTVFALLCVGVVLVASTAVAYGANNIDVSARIDAAPLTEAAEITSPAADAVVKEPSVEVHGNCPAKSYVKVFHNDILSGVSPCTNGAFAVQSDLFKGANRLTAQAYNVTDQAGPVSQVVMVMYQPTQLDPIDPNQPNVMVDTNGAVVSAGPGQSPPLLLNTTYSYRGVKAGGSLGWTLKVLGGVPAYALHIDWGDGSNDTRALADNGDVAIAHTYKKAGTYIITIDLTDTSGAKTHLQLFALVRGGTDGAGTGTTAINPLTGVLSSAHNGLQKWVWMVWPVYGTVSLMAFSFWLGERRELQHLGSIGRVRARK